VLDIPEVTADPQVAARGAIVVATHPQRPAFRQLGPLLAGTPRQDGYQLRDATLTDTPALLAEAGVPAAEIEALLAEGVIA
jgi:crotonobetainyl-CoA:carnitine CoA-transferase CaiB-like acyl-CoA transferase